MFSGDYADYTITVDGNTITVSGPDGTDTLTDVETLQFADGSVESDTIGEPPVVTVETAQGNEDTAIALDIAVLVPNAMEGVASVTIAGVPAGGDPVGRHRQRKWHLDSDRGAA